MSSQIDVAGAREKGVNTTETTHTPRDAILYALGVGAKRFELDLVYENASGFKVLPTYAVVPAFAAMWEKRFNDFLPKYNPMMLLHGEQLLTLHSAIPSSGTIFSTARVIDILDKGKGAAVIVSVESKDKDTGKLIATADFNLFIRGLGGFGGRKNLELDHPFSRNDEVPTRDPDAVAETKTTEEQAVVYRLSGDVNPLHVDPEESKKGGFDVPILHGLCTFGVAGKAVLEKFCDGDVTKFKQIKVRFSKPVFPGETLRTEMWREKNKVLFQVRVVDRPDVIAISSAYVEIED
ncbi:Thioesterase/thiol ester dehydrase-isomerase [Gonapodya prolifera JEL478]|uniref:Thioesterase/thiol ester dehydrase-isomerase n=1 Tax=Gonapodya prolifera (strain JEL478) TaxID=1344416 RepID=A0A139AWK3_GONPJ|nr:Thioesterase/thiol ester dehydrase-isomerase [Gonapodya prolifera JEL478]|eukprot:KXS21087.1 Thioesterase/thiol ester dehydrase-isomerase [Gonapodya prolifera JEL478]